MKAGQGIPGSWLAVAFVAACSSLPDLEDAALARSRHVGPPVALGTSGTARFVGNLIAAHHASSAPEEDGRAVPLARIEERLRKAGFGRSGGSELAWIGDEGDDGDGRALVASYARPPEAGQEPRTEWVLLSIDARSAAVSSAACEILRVVRPAQPRRGLAIVFGARPELLTEAFPSRPFAALLVVPGAARTPATLVRAPDPESLPGPAEVPVSGLSVVARSALIDADLFAGSLEGTLERAWAPGAASDAWLARGVPAVVLEIPGDDAEEPALVDATAAALAAALALADASPEDLERHLESVNYERRAREVEVDPAGSRELPEAWATELLAARMWLRALCLGLEPFAPLAPMTPAGAAAESDPVSSRP